MAMFIGSGFIPVIVWGAHRFSRRDAMTALVLWTIVFAVLNVVTLVGVSHE